MTRMKRFFLRAAHYVLSHVAAWDESVVRRLNAEEAPGVSEALLPPMAEDPFFKNVTLITHAGGGMSGLAYLNCAEAFERYYDSGNRVFEYDVQLVDGSYVLSHDGTAETIDGRFHPMTLTECLELIKKYPDLTVIFDCKFSDLTPFAAVVRDALDDRAVRRTVIQVFSEENAEQVRKVGPFQILYVCFMGTDYARAANLCIKNGIGAVSVSEKALKERTGWQVFPKSNIRVYAYTVNRLSEFQRLSEMGVSGVFSDFLTADDFRKWSGSEK